MPVAVARSFLTSGYALFRPLFSDACLLGRRSGALGAVKHSSLCFSSASTLSDRKIIDFFTFQGLIFSKTHSGYCLVRFSCSIPEQKGTVEGKQATSPGDKVKEALKVAEESSELSVSNYWGITTKPILREDGTVWPWHSFRPSETYHPDKKIDLKRHHVPDTFIDKFAFWTVKALRWPTDLFFQKRYGCRAMMLETVAAVPGMVAGMLLHLRSLRRFEHSGGWIKALLEEAENERMHLMTFMEVAKPLWYERVLVFVVQGIFFNAYFLLYIISPRLAHRITGYLEEEAIYSYTEYLKEIDNGHLPNIPAPAIAIDYWRLPKTATIRDVVEVVRADEAHHRDVNHFAADVHEEGKPLSQSPAPLGYH